MNKRIPIIFVILAIFAACLIFCFVIFPLDKDPLFRNIFPQRQELQHFCGTVEGPSSEYAPTNSDSEQRGEVLFKMNCASCHSTKLTRDMTGPALYKVMDRTPSRDWTKEFIRNSSQMIENGDAYAVAIFQEWNQAQMTAMPHLSDQDLEDLIEYMDY